MIESYVSFYISMQQMDETSLEVMLESFDNLPDLVFNYLNDADPATTNQQITFVVRMAKCVFCSCTCALLVLIWSPLSDLQVLCCSASVFGTSILEPYRPFAESSS